LHGDNNTAASPAGQPVNQIGKTVHSSFKMVRNNPFGLDLNLVHALISGF
jgi:hypothetical protein